jgi:hypothetical protein
MRVAGKAVTDRGYSAMECLGEGDFAMRLIADVI